MKISGISIGGDRYDGFSFGSDNAPSGKGTIKYKNGLSFDGVLQNGKRVDGTLTFPYYFSYFGEFVDDLPCGKGYLY